VSPLRLPQPTQAQRVLAQLQRAGSRGLTALDFLAPDVVDGGPPITRLASRIADLKRDGHGVVATVEPVGRARVAVYRLAAAQPAPVVGQVDAPATAQASLDVGDLTTRRPRSPLDPDADQ
jgi:hypothetical protein